MLMIGDIFYIMLFVTTAGGVLTVLSLAAVSRKPLLAFCCSDMVK